MTTQLKVLALFLLITSFVSSPASAGLKDDIGHTELQAELGENLPDGSGVSVLQVEAPSLGSWMPDTGHVEFTGKTIIDITGDDGISGHATSVGRYFYGNASSLAPGVTDIAVFEANHFIQNGFLRFNYYGFQPDQSTSRVANHSWVSTLPPTFSGEILRRLDWVVMGDEFIQVAALNNGSTQKELLSNAFNVIAVGRTDANHPRGSAFVDDTYTSGRTRPDLVVPKTSTSGATPVISSAVALLVELGHENPMFSSDPVIESTTNRNGDTIYNAERAEVIKAALMAGADRATENTEPGDIVDYRQEAPDRTDNGLDRRYGAGQLNIYNAYQIISSGEQNSMEDDSGEQGLIGYAGFDYDPSFGGAGGSNTVASYYFTADSEHTVLCVSLVWNLRIAGGLYLWAFDGTATLYDLDIRLYDMTEGGLEIASSKSLIDNTENLFVPLTSGHDYLIQLAPGQGQGDFEWDYGLAWQVKAGNGVVDSDGDTISDDVDNCLLTPNADQLDTDADGYGNACDCDFNNDDMVNIYDYMAFKGLWLATGPSDADFNGDNMVNIYDYITFKSRWLSTAPYY